MFNYHGYSGPCPNPPSAKDASPGSCEKRGKKIYVASSWRNARQPDVVRFLRSLGHDVYDYRNPAPGEHGFSWSEIDPRWERWTPDQHVEALRHPVAVHGFNRDMTALRECDVCVLVLPCGRSAHLELGWAAGAGKTTYVLEIDPTEPDLMYAMCDWICTSLDQLRALLEIEAQK